MDRPNKGGMIMDPEEKKEIEEEAEMTEQQKMIMGWLWFWTMIFGAYGFLSVVFGYLGIGGA